MKKLTALLFFLATQALAANPPIIWGPGNVATILTPTLGASAVTLTGVATFSAGSSSAPSLTFSGDTNTGLYSTAADNVSVTTGGTERFRVDSSGNMTVGSVSTAPVSRLEVADTNPILTLTDTQNTGWGTGNSPTVIGSSRLYGKMSFRTRDTSGIGAHETAFIGVSDDWTGTTTTPPGALIFGTGATNVAATEVARIDEFGNFGLGVTNFGTTPTHTLGLANGTAPNAGITDAVQVYSSDLSAGNTIPSFYTEGSGVSGAGTSNVTVTTKIAIRVNGTVYYLLATTNGT